MLTKTTIGTDMNNEFNEACRVLDNWARWNRTASGNLGYPKKSLMMAGGGGYEKSTDDFYTEIDQHAAEVTDTLVHDLPEMQRYAIYNRWLGCNYWINDYSGELLKAYIEIEAGMQRRGLC
jgi:hypothetical protein